MAGTGRFSVEAIFRALDRFSGPVLRMQTRTQAFAARATRALRTVEMGAAGLSGKLDRIGGSMKRLAMTVGLPAAAAGAIIGKIGSDFEQAITNVGAVMLKGRGQIVALEQQALELGRRTQFTASEAASAMEVMARAGFSQQEIMQGVSGVLDAAAASGLEMAEVADHVSNVLKGMGKSSKDAEAAVKAMGLKGADAAKMIAQLTMDTTQATRVADVLAYASSKTNSTIGTLGESMRNVAATARQLNIPFESIVATVASLQDVGLDASVAGSAVNTMLSKMAALTAPMKAKLRSMGVAFEDAHGNALPFSQIIAGLARGGDKAGGTMKRLEFFTELVGLRGQKAASNLATLFETGKLEQLIKELDNAGGKAREMADIRLQTVQGQFKILWSAISDVAIELFKTEAGPLRGMVEGVKDWVGANKEAIVSGFVEFMGKIRANMADIEKWAKRIAIGVGIFIALSIAAKAVESAMILAQGAMYAFRAAVWLVNGAIAIVKGGMLAYRTASVLYTLVTYGAAGATWALLAPILLTTAAIGAAVAAVIWLAVEIKKLLDVSGGLQGLMAGIQSWNEGEGFFAGIDKFQNEQARKEAAMRKRMPSAAPGVATAPGTGALENASGGFRQAQTALAGVNPVEQNALLSKLATGIEGMNQQRADVEFKQAMTALGSSSDGLGDSVSGLSKSVNRFADVMAVPPAWAGFGRTETNAGGSTREQQMIPPRATHVVDEKKTTHEERIAIEVSAQPGSDVRVTRPPKGNNTKLRVGASGTF
jgi:TP901 family phage tail tape measure protein